MCGSLAGTCFRNVSRATDQRDYMGWMPGSCASAFLYWSPRNITLQRPQSYVKTLALTLT